jgi:hypothetical protein
MTAGEMEVLGLRRAMMSLGGPPQAQRHHARMGLLERACLTVEGAPTKLPGLARAGRLDAAQVARVMDVAGALAGLERGWRDRLPPPASGFEFLWSDAFEDPEWDAMRRRARSAFTALRGSGGPLGPPG